MEPCTASLPDTALTRVIDPLQSDPIAVPACVGTGAAEIDAALPWAGLPRGLHEVSGEVGEAAKVAFAASLAGRRSGYGGRPILWCRPRRVALTAGDPYGPGMAHLGISPDALILVEAEKPADLLWAMEEGARTKGLAAVVAEGVIPNLTASRRLQLAAEVGNGLVLLLPKGRQTAPSSALTRWFVRSLPSRQEAGGPGSPRWHVELWRCRGGGRLREWIVEWDDAAFSLSVVPQLADGSLAAPAQDGIGAIGAQRSRAGGQSPDGGRQFSDALGPVRRPASG
jgi:protein ImuA